MKQRTPKSKYTVTTKRGEARTEKSGVSAGQPFGINKAARRLKKKGAA